MDQIRNILSDTWLKYIEPQFNEGYLTYERQLQAEIYFHLKSKLGNDYRVWIEPVIHGLNYCKPDIIVTKNNHVAAIIEIKFRPWDYPAFKSDIDKLIRFDNWSTIKRTLIFGYIPFSDNWQIQKTMPDIRYELDKHHLNVLIVVAKSDCDVFQIGQYNQPQNFLLLTGHIKKDLEPHFKVVE